MCLALSSHFRLSGNNCIAFVRNFLETQQMSFLGAGSLYCSTKHSSVFIYFAFEPFCKALCGRETWGGMGRLQDFLVVLTCWSCGRFCISAHMQKYALDKSGEIHWSWYRSHFKTHLEQKSDDLLKILRFSFVLILSCNNMVCQIKTNALIRT